MAVVYKDIRAAFEVALQNIVGIPDIAWENVSYTPAADTSYVKPRLFPLRREPAVRGLNPQMRYSGVFRVDCFVPEGAGPLAGEELAELIIEAFEATTDLVHNTTYVSIQYAEREQGIQDGAHYMIPVSIGWYCYK